MLTLILAKRMARGDYASPVINVEEISGGYRLIITDSGKTESFDVLNGKGPIIGNNGNWMIWDAGAGEYIDTGQAASGNSDSITVNALLNALSSLSEEEREQALNRLGAMPADGIEDGVVDFDGVVIDPTENEEVIEF